MGQRLLGAVLFLLPATCLFEIAGRLASEQRGGWGWFLLAGLTFCGVALNLWTGEFPIAQLPRCQKPRPADEWE